MFSLRSTNTMMVITTRSTTKMVVLSTEGSIPTTARGALQHRTTRPNDARPAPEGSVQLVAGEPFRSPSSISGTFGRPNNTYRATYA